MEQILKNMPFSGLSKREKQVLELMLKGALVKDICKSLDLKSNTISTFKKNIFTKTGTTNVIELFQLASDIKKQST
jgi:two-component system invasion response regulator UvrY